MSSPHLKTYLQMQQKVIQVFSLNLHQDTRAHYIQQFSQIQKLRFFMTCLIKKKSVCNLVTICKMVLVVSISHRNSMSVCHQTVTEFRWHISNGIEIESLSPNFGGQFIPNYHQNSVANSTTEQQPHLVVVNHRTSTELPPKLCGSVSPKNFYD